MWTTVGLLGGTLVAFVGTLSYVGTKIGALGGRIDALGADLTGRIDAQGARLDGRIDAVNADLGRRIDALSARMDDHLLRHTG